MYVNPSPAERLILENQQAIMRGVRTVLLAIGGGIADVGADTLKDRMVVNAAALKQD